MEPFKDLSDVDLFELKERTERASIDLYFFLAIYFFFFLCARFSHAMFCSYSYPFFIA